MTIYNSSQNPIDVIEDLIYSKKWSFSRAADHELVADISSNWCQYRLYFSWSEAVGAISLTVTFDIKFPEFKMKKAQELLAYINERLWIGHFDITSKNGIPAFRHTVLQPPENDMLYSHLENLMDISICECEKYYPAFQLVLFDDTRPKEAIEISAVEVLGRA